MSVYNDMASDAGCDYGTYENEQLASMAESEHYRKLQEDENERCAAEEAEESQALRTTAIMSSAAAPAKANCPSCKDTG